MLRLDDTDRERSTEEFADGIRARSCAGSASTGTREERQSARLARYEEAAAALKEPGRLYPCYETEDELDRKRKRQLARGLPPIYDRAGLKLDDAERAKLEAEGRRPHWRFRLANTAEERARAAADHRVVERSRSAATRRWMSARSRTRC